MPHPNPYRVPCGMCGYDHRQAADPCPMCLGRDAYRCGLPLKAPVSLAGREIWMAAWRVGWRREFCRANPGVLPPDGRRTQQLRLF